MPDTPKVTIPATVAEAADALGAIDRLLTSRAWERAAIVAAFVTPSGLTADEFAALGIRGLTTPATVRLYVERWLALGLGCPQPGEVLALPTAEWEPTRTGTDGHNSAEGAAATVRRIAERHPDAIGNVLAGDPELAKRVVEQAVQHPDVRRHAEGAAFGADEAERRQVYADRGMRYPEPGDLPEPARANVFHALAVLTGDARHLLGRFARAWEAQAGDPNAAYRLDAQGIAILVRDLTDIIDKADLLRTALQGAPADLSDLLAEEGGR